MATHAAWIERLDPAADGMPHLAGVRHLWVHTPGGVRIHVAELGPTDGSPVVLVHGFPQHWWEWHRIMGPLAADGHRVIVPDLRGAGWSDAPAGPYRKEEMARDLAEVLDAMDVGRVRVVAHDWGGPVAFCLLLRHPGRVSGFLGLNTIAPWLRADLALLRHTWRFWYQVVILTPGVGPRLLRSRRKRFLRFLARWVGGGWSWPEQDEAIYLDRIAQRSRAQAGSQWYRTFQAREFVPWLRGRYDGIPVDVPLRWVTGVEDPVIRSVLHRGYAERASDVRFEEVPGVGHWIVEQAHDLTLDRVRRFLVEVPG